MSKNISPRRALKKEIAGWKRYRRDLPRLIDCGKVYGDTYWNEDDIKIADEKINELEERLAKLPQP